ncbi:unnamed protein product [Calypogeia fissa]
MYSPLNRSPRRQYTALHDEYLALATSFFRGFQGREQDLIHSNESYSNHSQAAAFFDIGGDAPRVSTAVVVMASKRRVPYAQIWAWSLLTGSSPTDLNQTSVTIINTQKPSSANSEDLQPLRDAGISVVDMYEGDGSESWNGKEWSDWLLDEYLSHIEALRACDRDGIRWCIVFEEDSLLTRDMLGKFRTHVVEELQSRAYVGMVKLFTTDAWSGYQWPSWLQDLLLIPFCLAAVLTIPFGDFLSWANSILCERRRRNVSPLPTSRTSPAWKKKRSFLKLALSFATLFGNIVVVAEVMSRQSVVAMLDFPAIHIDRCTSAASTVAVAFPVEITKKLREHLEGVVQSGNKARSFPIDLEIYFWADSIGFSVLKTSPSLAQHIGLFSSNPVKQHVAYLSQDSRFTLLAGENFFHRAVSRFVPAW